MKAKEIKITEKTTKQGFVNILKDYLKSNVVDKNLSDRIKYALDMFSKDMTKVAKSDLRELAEEAIKALTPATPAPVEASLKPKKPSGNKSTKTAEPAEEVEETSEEEETETAEAEEEAPAEPKKSGKKSSLKKSDKDSKKKNEVKTSTPVTTVGADRIPCAKMFPAEIDHPELGKLIACTGAYTSYDAVLKALEAEKTLYFACYWTKRHIKEYGYNYLFDVEAPKGGFPDNLDLLMAVLPCETVKRLFAMSRITEALYRFDDEDFEYIEDTDPATNEKFLVRASQGMEFEIYRPADEEVVTTK